MARDLSFGIEIVGCPIIREEDGLAKSSRNTYLSSDERSAATVISKALSIGNELIVNGETNAETVLKVITEKIESEPLARIDYVKAVDADSIEPIQTVSGRVLFAVAVYIGKTRLIDNFIAERN